jgi:hypothetical protein
MRPQCVSFRELVKMKEEIMPPPLASLATIDDEQAGAGVDSTLERQKRAQRTRPDGGGGGEHLNRHTHIQCAWPNDGARRRPFMADAQATGWLVCALDGPEATETIMTTATAATMMMMIKRTKRQKVSKIIALSLHDNLTTPGRRHHGWPSRPRRREQGAGGRGFPSAAAAYEANLGPPPHTSTSLQIGQVQAAVAAAAMAAPVGRPRWTTDRQRSGRTIILPK